MPDVSSPGKLKEFCINLEKNDGLGLLVSGGSLKDGRVPIKPFLQTIRWVKNHTSLLINLHTGIVSKTDAEEIAASGIDVASVDVVGSQETLRAVYGLSYSVDKYFESALNLKLEGVRVAPHICVGLHYGKILGEFDALKLASEIKPEVLVLIGLIPTIGTPMEEVPPPSIETMVRVIHEARRICPESDISLGCMRSRDNKTSHEIESIKAGVNRVALASRSTERWALENGYGVKRIESCCAV
jgi:uncharacterized radical SAM superfamily protein